VAISFGVYMAMFNVIGGGRTEVRLPEKDLTHLKTRLLIGVKQHEYLVSRAWIDEMNMTYPYILADVVEESISFSSTLGSSFKIIKFITE